MIAAMINILAELERIGVTYDWASAEEVKCKCPFHDDNSPSCYVNLEKQQFKCQASGCSKHGDIITLLSRYLKTTRKVLLTDLSKRYDLNLERTIDPTLVEKYHTRIWKALPLLNELYKRGLTDNDVREHRLGEHNGRITIPIKNPSGLFVNIRSYLPGAPGTDKMRNLKGRGNKLRLYPVEQLRYRQIVITGGEIKAIAGAARLNAQGIGCVTVVGGEGAWDLSFNTEFAGRDVWTVFDIDEGGRKASETICKYLYRTASSVRDVELPLDKDKFPKGDLNDYVVNHDDLYDVLMKAPSWQPQLRQLPVNEKPQDVELAQAIHADLTGKRVRLTAIASTLDTAPYVIPNKVKVKCSRDLKECATCPVWLEKEDHEYDIHPESPVILEMVAQRKSAQQAALQDDLSIPPTCKVCKFEAVSYFNVEDSRISPRLEISNRTNERVMLPAICIGDGLELNETYEMIGRMHPHPLTQQSTLLISKYKASQDALSSYKCRDPESLLLFQPDEWTLESLTQKLDHISHDLETNVTGIFDRQPIQMMIDLAYHSPLFINFEGKTIKGWVEVLIVGDSSQGKSETAINLQNHYGLGEKVECKNASVAGLLGGLQQLGSRWFITWGVIPTHDKRLVILEEVKGASVEVISKLTDMRSSGVAEIPKIEKRRTYARTRLVALSNPRSDIAINRYNFGIESIKELIGGLEDVRRFDACLIVAEGEVDSSKINQLQAHKPTCPHVYTSDLCRKLVLWSWTRDDVEFEPDAVDEILKSSIDMCNTFTESIPIVDKGSMRYKLARLSSSLAARTFSTDKLFNKLIVKRCHVQYVCKFLTAVYSTKAFGYSDYTAAVKASNTLLNSELIVKHINDSPFPADLVQHLLHTNKIEIQDIQDWCAWDRQNAQNLLSLLVRKHALIRENRAYRKTSPFIELLKDLEGKTVERPDFIEEHDEF